MRIVVAGAVILAYIAAQFLIIGKRASGATSDRMTLGLWAGSSIIATGAVGIILTG